MLKKLKPFSVILSILLSVILMISTVITTFISVSREYLTSAEFNSMIDNTVLATMKFMNNGEKITLEKFIKNYVTEKIENHIKNNPLSNFTNFLFPIADSITDFTVDKALSSEFINSTVKGELHSIIDYFLYSDVDQAKDRIKNGITLENNFALNPDNATTYEERIKAEVKISIFKYIEEETGKSCDEIIVLLSEKTISDLKLISLLVFVLLVVVSIPAFPIIFFLLTIVSVVCKYRINSFVNDFETHFAGKEDLILYELIKPLMSEYGTYADYIQMIGIASVAIFVVCMAVMYFRKKK